VLYMLFFVRIFCLVAPSYLLLGGLCKFTLLPFDPLKYHSFSDSVASNLLC